jgi:hypothetical protein
MSRKLDYRFEAMIALTAFLSLLVLYSGFYNWWGGWTFGPRYLIPMLCFMSMPLAFLPGRWFPGTIILAVISIFQMLIPISSRVLVPDDFRKIINKPGFSLYASIYDYGLPQLLDGKFAKNLGNLFLGLESWRSLLPLLLVVCIITIIFFRRQEYPRRFSSQA